ncbi:MAG: flagellar filament capping protein FliD [Steroidobacteraceae bacterium]|jgi:flagellar hook-associated protein 2
MSTSSTSTTPVSVASSSSAGAAGGSVIDVSSLVSQLVQATEAPQQTLINNQTSAVTTEISAIGTLSSALSTFQSSLSSLDSPDQFNSETATSSDQTVFTATAGSGAVNGNFSIGVTTLASAQQILSGAFAGGSSAAVGTGTLSLSLGGTSFSLAVNSSNNTLSGIAAAINSATDNPGISAAVIQGTDGAHLLLTSTLTGAANTIQVTETDGGTSLKALTYGTGNTGNYTENADAADAAFSVAGVNYTSASNTVTDALSGVTLDLLGTTAVDTPATLTVASDTSGIVSNVQSFVTAYNTLQTALQGLGSYDAATGTADPLMDNPLLTGIQSQIQGAIYSLVGSSNYNSLASVGITSNADGSLTLNSTTLTNALTSNFSAVSNLFSGSTGVATQLNTQITSDLASGGSITTASATLVTQENNLTTQTNQLNTQMAALSASLTEQYSALNALLSSLQSTSSYLTQAFASLPLVQGTANA